MKKIVTTIAIILGLGMVSFAESTTEPTENYGLFGRGFGIFQNREETPLIPEYDQDGDFDAQSPVGSGIALLLGLGGAYLVAKRRKE